MGHSRISLKLSGSNFDPIPFWLLSNTLYPVYDCSFTVTYWKRKLKQASQRNSLLSQIRLKDLSFSTLSGKILQESRWNLVHCIMKYEGSNDGRFCCSH